MSFPVQGHFSLHKKLSILLLLSRGIQLWWADLRMRWVILERMPADFGKAGRECEQLTYVCCYSS